MTLAAVAPSPALAPAEVSRDAQVRDAATRFEGLLLQQLVGILRSSVEGGLFGDGAGAEMYAHLFDQSFADALAGAGGIGLRSVLERSMLGPRAYAAQASPTPTIGHPPAPIVRGEPDAVRPASGVALPGATGQLQAAARDMLPQGVAPQWGREGRLTHHDLASNFRSEGPSGVAVFNVEDAAGFEDRYKCNLFAFELARRAGFVVPLIGRGRGWGYLGPDGVVADAESGALRRDWGRIVTGESAESLDAAIVRGERAFVLAGRSVGDRAGHMGVIERVHEIEHDAEGRIVRVVFDGWEGRSQGARHLERRVWTRYGHPSRGDVRGGFDRIELIELRRPAPGERPELPLHPHARPSVHDLNDRSAP